VFFRLRKHITRVSKKGGSLIMNTETNTKVTKRDYGDGSISYIESKKLWEARLSYGKAGNGNRDRRSRYAKTKPDARKLLKKMIIERDAAINFNAQLYLMKDYYEIWLNEKKGQIKENSYIRIRQVVETINVLLVLLILPDSDVILYEIQLYPRHRIQIFLSELCLHLEHSHSLLHKIKQTYISFIYIVRFL